jgi:hypothetical protein
MRYNKGFLTARIVIHMPIYVNPAEQLTKSHFSDIYLYRKGGDDKCAVITRISMNTSMSTKKRLILTMVTSINI